MPLFFSRPYYFFYLISCLLPLFSAHAHSIKLQLQQLEKSNHSRLGVTLIDAITGKTYVTYRESERFPFCSTSKVIAVGSLLKLSERQPQLLKQPVKISPDNMAGYNPITEKYIHHSLTYAQLCAAALQYSDNAAMNLILHKVGGPQAVTQYARQLGDKQFRLDRYEPQLNSAIPGDPRDTTTPMAMAHSVSKLAFGHVLTPEKRTLLINWMKSNTTGEQSIKAGLPTDWLIADKTGSGDYGTTNDVAIIWPPNHDPLIMVIYLTQKQHDAEARRDLIAKTAQIITQNLRFSTNNKK